MIADELKITVIDIGIQFWIVFSHTYKHQKAHKYISCLEPLDASKSWLEEFSQRNVISRLVSFHFHSELRLSRQPSSHFLQSFFGALFLCSTCVFHLPTPFQRVLRSFDISVHHTTRSPSLHDVFTSHSILQCYVDRFHTTDLWPMLFSFLCALRTEWKAGKAFANFCWPNCA